MAQESAEGRITGRWPVVSDQPPRRRYANAADVLPRELFRAVQKHFVGTLYVGSESVFHKERERIVRQLHAQGVSSSEIANAAGVSMRRVQQILAKVPTELGNDA